MNKRPFYTEYAWAYDDIIESQAPNRCRFILSLLRRHNISKNAKILDAGCGTGNYTLCLSKHGYKTTGIDLSPELIKIAKNKATKEGIKALFKQGDISNIKPTNKYNLILCRGVLNDILKQKERRRIFKTFASVICPKGLLIFDVREWFNTIERKTNEPIFKKSVKTKRGIYTFCSETKLIHKTHDLLISESHFYEGKQSKYVFKMHCWTCPELEENLMKAGFRNINYYGAYDFIKLSGSNDRIVITASL